MKLSEPINIMLDCRIPDKKKLLGELGKLTPGDTLQVKIDSCITSKAMVESYLKHKWFRIVDAFDHDDATILCIRMVRDVWFFHLATGFIPFTLKEAILDPHRKAN